MLKSRLGLMFFAETVFEMPPQRKFTDDEKEWEELQEDNSLRKGYDLKLKDSWCVGCILHRRRYNGEVRLPTVD